MPRTTNRKIILMKLATMIENAKLSILGFARAAQHGAGALSELSLNLQLCMVCDLLKVKADDGSTALPAL